MDPILICHPPGDAAATARAQARLAGLPAAERRGARVVAAGEDDLPALAAAGPQMILATGHDPGWLACLSPLRAPCIWDLGGLEPGTMSRWLAEPGPRAALERTLGCVHSVADLNDADGRAIEDALLLGLPRHDLARAMEAARTRIAVVVGAGLGNMIYATPMVRWIAERRGAPVDLIIHDRFDEAVALFSAAPWLNVVHNGLTRLAGRRWDLVVSAVTAGGWRPPFEAGETLWLHLEHSYNEEGRFVPEPRLNFLGLERIFGGAPGLAGELAGEAPMPFIRDIAYRPPGKRILGIAHGQKSSAWAKREWPGAPELVAQLVADGWEVRSFGLPGEHVPGAIDRTGLPMRQVVEEIAECACFLSHDGGLCHVAEAIGVPTIWLFGATGSVKNGPVYAHSPVLLSWRGCGPCLYKIDWLRCADPACMRDLSVAEVRAALETLHAQLERDGYTPAPRPLDARLLDYELAAPERPSPDWTQPVNLRERLALFGPGEEGRQDTRQDTWQDGRQDGRPARRLAAAVIALLARGDVAGAAALASHLARSAPGTPAARFLVGLLAQVHPGPTPVAGPLADLRLAPLAPAEMPDLAAALAALDLDRGQRRFAAHAGLRYWQQAGRVDLALAFGAALLAEPAFAAEHARRIQRVLARLATGARRAAQDGLGALAHVVFDPSPPLQRMRALRELPMAELLAGNLAWLAEAEFGSEKGPGAGPEAGKGDAAQGADGDDDDDDDDDAAALPAALARARARLVADGPAAWAPRRPALPEGRRPPVRLDLGAGGHQIEAEIAVGRTVLILAPHVRPRGAPAASVSPLILAHAERLAMLGLAPVIVTPGFDALPERCAMRNSVLLLQGHPDWDAAAWGELVRAFDPALVLAYDGIEARLDLPGRIGAPLVPLAVTGLADPAGLFEEFQPANLWSTAPASVPASVPASGPAYASGPAHASVPDPAGAIPADALSAALFAAPDPAPRPAPRPAATPHRRLRITVLMPDAADFRAMERLARAVPEADFEVMTPLLFRGIEKNLASRPVGPLGPDEIGDLLLQFTTRPATLSADILRRIETGGRALAAPLPTLPEPLAAHLTRVETPAATASWLAALRRIAVSGIPALSAAPAP